jgi:hemolysin III
MDMQPQPRPTLRGVSHQFAFFAALGAGAVLTATAGSARAAVAVAIYAGSLAAMFGISATYHRLARRPRARAIWQRADHAAIFLFIAGTYTPITVLALRTPVGSRLLAMVWGGAALGVIQSLVWPRAPRAIAAALYVALGWSIVACWSDVATAVAPSSLVLLIVGGALYTAGALTYALRRPDPAPRVFGYHEVFHALVIAACVCHFAAVFQLVRAA